MSFKNVSHAFRVLAGNAGFSAVVIAVLAFGIGASTSIFSFVHGVLLKPLPFEESERLVWIWQQNPDEGISREYAAVGDFMDWREMSESFEDLAAFYSMSLVVSGEEGAKQVVAAGVTSGFFELLRVEPLIGRRFTAEEEQPGEDGVVILSHQLWRQSYGSDRGIAGETLIVDGRSRTVIGVLPASFRFDPLRRAEIFLPATFSAEERRDRTGASLSVFGRLKPGVSFEAARRELAVVGQRRSEAYPTREGWGVYPELLRKAVAGQAALPIQVFAVASLFLLLIICWNVANLQLAQLQGRKHELATRLALGATRRDLVGQLVRESVVLALGGGLGGLLIGQWGTRLLRSSLPGDIPRLDEVGIDMPVLGFALLLSLGSTLIFGLLPAFRASRTDPWRELQQGGSRSGGGLRSRRFQNALVMLQLGFVIPLLVAAVLLFRSFLEMQAFEPGFRTGDVYRTSIVLPAVSYGEADQRVAFYDRLVEGLVRRPGIATLGAATNLPFSGSVQDIGFAVEGRPQSGTEQKPVALFDAVALGFFRTLGVPVVKGRVFGEQDQSTASPVVIVNETLALRYFPAGDPIGQRLQIGRTTREIVGVVGDVRDPTLGPVIRPQLYVPYTQVPLREMGLLVRSRAPLATVAGWIRSEVRALDPRLPPPTVTPLEDRLAEILVPSRLYARLMASFSFAAVLVAALGLYGLLAHSVDKRRNEIGIRRAHGALGRDILRLVVGEGMAVALAALLFGIVLAVVAARVLASLLHGIPAADPLTLFSVALILAVTALAAAALPVRRALRVDPVRVLRYE